MEPTEDVCISPKIESFGEAEDDASVKFYNADKALSLVDIV